MKGEIYWTETEVSFRAQVELGSFSTNISDWKVARELTLISLLRCPAFLSEMLLVCIPSLQINLYVSVYLKQLVYITSVLFKGYF